MSITLPGHLVDWDFVNRNLALARQPTAQPRTPVRFDSESVLRS